MTPADYLADADTMIARLRYDVCYEMEPLPDRGHWIGAMLYGISAMLVVEALLWVVRNA